MCVVIVFRLVGDVVVKWDGFMFVIMSLGCWWVSLFCSSVSVLGVVLY